MNCARSVLALLLTMCLVACNQSSAATPPLNATDPVGSYKVPDIHFTVLPANVSRGDTAVLSWTVSGATRVEIEPGLGLVASAGNQTVLPENSTQYVLKAYYAGGMAIGRAWLNVVAPTYPGQPVMTPPVVPQAPPADTPLPPQITGVPVSPSPPPPPATGYVGSSALREFHYPYCSIAMKIPLPSKVWFSSVAEAQAADYRPCVICRPDK